MNAPHKFKPIRVNMTFKIDKQCLKKVSVGPELLV